MIKKDVDKCKYFVKYIYVKYLLRKIRGRGREKVKVFVVFLFYFVLVVFRKLGFLIFIVIWYVVLI